MTKLAMPKIDRKLISKKVDVIADLKKIIKAENILDHEDQIRPFETDALSAYKQKPLIVVFPENTEEVSKILAYCNQERIKVIPRGAGTGLSGPASSGIHIRAASRSPRFIGIHTPFSNTLIL